MRKISAIFWCGPPIALAILLLVTTYEIKRIGDSANNLVLSAKPAISRLEGTVQEMNAVLVHADLIVGRAEEASRTWRDAYKSQEKYWAAIQAKSVLSLDKIDVTLFSVNELIVSATNQINSVGLATSDTIVQTKITLEKLSSSIELTQAETAKILDDTHTILSDQSIPNALDSIAETLRHINSTSASIDEASKTAPNLVKNIEKMSKTASKLQVYVILAGIVSAIARIF